MPAPASAPERLYRRAAWRIIPYLFLCYIFNYLDRVNVGFAKLDMLDALGMSEAAYGFGAGIFFLGYVAGGVPSNLLLERVGPRRWLAAIMICWGALSAGLLLVRTPATFYVLRCLTGAAEAGFFPGIVLYLGRWFPSARQGRVMALFMAAIPLSGVVGGPLSGWMLGHFAGGPRGLAAWQWLFLLQGLPTVLLGIGLLFVLADSPDEARWLDRDEREMLARALARDRATPVGRAERLGDVARSGRIWALGAIYFAIQAGVYALNFWLPTIIKAGGIADPRAIGWLSAIPYAAAAGAMLLIGRSADRLDERRWHLAGPMLGGAAGLIAATWFAGSTGLALAGLSLAAVGALSSLPMFWPVAARELPPSAAAGGLALINSLGQVAGFASPYFVGWIKGATGTTDCALAAIAAVLVLGAATLLLLTRARGDAVMLSG